MSLCLHSICFLQNILSILWYNSVRECREDNFKAEVVEKEEALQTAKSNAEAASKQYSDQIELLEASANDMKSTKESAEEEVKKEKARADEAMQAVKVLQKSLEMAKVAEEETKNAYRILSKDKLDLKA